MGIDPSTALRTTTLATYLKTKIEPIFRKSVVFAGMKSAKRVSYGNSGTELKWFPRVRRRKITASDGYNHKTSFAEFPSRMEVTLPWRRYTLGEKLSKFTKLANQGSDVRLFSVVRDVIDGMAEDFIDDLATKVYEDGNATNSKDIHGFESCMSVNGVVLGGKVGSPDDTYAGKSTALSALGGDWTGVFPVGHGDPESYAWSPLVVDTTNALFNATTHTWAGQWRQVLNFATSYLGRLQKRKPDICILHTDMLVEAKDSLIGSERFVVTPKSPLVDLGFKTLMYDNLEIADEYAVPEGVGYLLSWDAIELKSMQKELVTYADDMVIETMDQVYAAEFFGNMMIQAPSFLAKLQAITNGS